MMKERFSKLLLGEDMSGSGNGVCTALAISNAITNLCGMCNHCFLLGCTSYNRSLISFGFVKKIKLPCSGNYGG